MVRTRMVWQHCQLAWCDFLNWPEIAVGMIRCMPLEDGASQDLLAVLSSNMSAGDWCIPRNMCDMCLMLRVWITFGCTMRQECCENEGPGMALTLPAMSPVPSRDNTTLSRACFAPSNLLDTSTAGPNLARSKCPQQELHEITPYAGLLQQLLQVYAEPLACD